MPDDQHAAPVQRIAHAGPGAGMSTLAPVPSTGPTSSQAAACNLAAATMLNLASRRPLPTGPQLGRLLLDVVTELAPHFRSQDLARNIDVYAADWAAVHAWNWLPTAAPLALTDISDALADASPSTLRLQHRLNSADGHAPVRLAWTVHVPTDAPADFTHGTRRVVLDEFVPAHRADAVVTDHLLRRLDAHHALGLTMPGYAGVRVLAPRIPRASVHIGSLFDIGDQPHPLGDCPVCAATLPQRY